MKLTPQFHSFIVLKNVMHSSLVVNPWCQKVKVLKAGRYSSSKSIIYWWNNSKQLMGNYGRFCLLSWESSRHLHTQTIRARYLTFLLNIHHPLCVTWHMSYVTCDMSSVRCHMSCVTCNISHANAMQIYIFSFYLLKKWMEGNSQLFHNLWPEWN